MNNNTQSPLKEKIYIYDISQTDTNENDDNVLFAIKPKKPSVCHNVLSAFLFLQCIVYSAFNILAENGVDYMYDAPFSFGLYLACFSFITIICACVTAGCLDCLTYLSDLEIGILIMNIVLGFINYRYFMTYRSTMNQNVDYNNQFIKKFENMN